VIARALAWLCAPERPVLAPVLRIVVCAWLLFMRAIDIGPHAMKIVVDRPPTVLDATHLVALMEAFGAWPATPTTLRAIWVVSLVAGGLALVGLATRAALLAFFVSLSILVGLAQGYGFFNHTPALPILVVFALVFVPGTTALSLDAVIVARVSGLTRAAGWPQAPRFGDLLLLLTIGLVYASAGIAKVRAGVAWFDGSALAAYLSSDAGVQHWLYRGDDVVAYSYMTTPARLARTLSQMPAAMMVLSWATLALELLAPVMLVWSRAARIVICLGTIAFHLGVRKLMGISFIDWIVIDATIAMCAFTAWWHQRRVASAPATERAR